VDVPRLIAGPQFQTSLTPWVGRGFLAAARFFPDVNRRNVSPVGADWGRAMVKQSKSDLHQSLGEVLERSHTRLGPRTTGH